MHVVHDDDASCSVASLQEHGEIAADKARAAGDQNAFWKGRHDSTGHAGVMDFFENPPQGVLKFPGGIVTLEFPHVADPPNMVADAVVFLVSPFQFATADLFAQVNRFEHGTI